MAGLVLDFLDSGYRCELEMEGTGEVGVNAVFPMPDPINEKSIANFRLELLINLKSEI
jgi:flagellar assembly factor FliW